MPQDAGEPGASRRVSAKRLPVAQRCFERVLNGVLREGRVSQLQLRNLEKVCAMRFELAGFGERLINVVVHAYYSESDWKRARPRGRARVRRAIGSSAGQLWLAFVMSAEGFLLNDLLMSALKFK